MRNSARAGKTAARPVGIRPPVARPWSPASLLAPIALMLIALCVFYNGLYGAFVYDDTVSIRDNPLIRRLWPLSDAMSLRVMEFGLTVSGRPILSLSFALNRAILGPEPWHYRIVNIGIHIAAGLLLFDIVRRTLQRCGNRNKKQSGTAPSESRLPSAIRNPQSAMAIAFGAALLWIVHPLQTASVTYIVQRAESLAGLFLLLTLYAAIRRLEGGGRPWTVLATTACILGMGTKQSAFAAPALVLLYDYTFLSRSMRDALRAHRGLYFGLASGWIFLGGIVAVWQLADSNPEIGARNPWPYALTQPEVILYYLRLSVWPTPVLAAYAWPYADSPGRILPPLIILAGLAMLTLWGIRRRSWLAFLGAWFFLTLAPSSSFFALEQIVQCQRMYLPLAAVAVLVAVGVYFGLAWITTPLRLGDWIVVTGYGVIIAMMAVPLAYCTLGRNRDYQDEWTFWQSNVRSDPYSRAAQVAFAALLLKKNQPEEAERHYREALRADDSASPDEAHYNLGVIALGRGELDEAMFQFQTALMHRPFQAEIVEKIGATFAAQGRFAEATAQLQRVFQLHPKPAVAAAAHNDLGTVLSRQGRTDEAAAHYRSAIQLTPNYPEAFNNLGSALVRLGRYQEAVAPYESALRLNANSADVHNNYGYVLLQLGRLDEAIHHLQKALLLNPAHPLARQNLAAAKVARGASD